MKKRAFLLIIFLMVFLLIVVSPNAYASTKTITYNAGTKIMTAIGGSSIDSITFYDLWNASNSNGWNVVNNTCNTQFKFHCRIILGNGTAEGETWFKDTNKQVIFNDGVLTSAWQRFIEIKAYAHATFGNVENISLKTTSSGISFISLEDYFSHYLMRVMSSTQSNLNLYSCHAIAHKTCGITGLNARIWNSLLTNDVYVTDASSSNVFNTIFSKGVYGVSYPQGTWDRVSMYEKTYALYLRYSSTLTNLYARANSYIFRAYSLSSDVYLINVDSDTWLTSWGGSASTNEIYRQYEFDLTVQYPNGSTIENASVVIQHYGENAGIDYNGTTNSEGKISQQTLTMGFYNQTGGNSLYDYNPYSLNITYGEQWQYYANFTLSEKTDWLISLVDPSTKGVGNIPFYLVGFVLVTSLICVAGYFAYKKKKG